MSKVFIPYLLFMGMQCLAGCEAPEDGEPHRLPYRMKFDLADVGVNYEFQVNVTKPGMYAISASFYTEHLNEYSHFFDKDNTREQSAHLFKMMGSKQDPVSLEWTQIGMPATFRVQLVRDADRHQLLDRLVTRQRTMGTFKGRKAMLAEEKLLPGIYTARVSYLDGICALFPLKGVISFHNTAPIK